MMPGIWRAWHQIGWAGVDVFFVLSGFLVGGILLDEYYETGGIRPGRFLLRRGAKIYPGFWAMLTVSSVVLPHISLARLAAELSFTQNYFLGLYDHTWSLAVEEHFYLLLALGLTVLAGWKGVRTLPAIWLTIALGTLLLRLWNADTREYGTLSHLFPTHLRVDSLLLGTVLAYGVRAYPTRFNRIRASRWLLPSSLALFALVVSRPVEDPLTHTLGLLILALAAGGLVIALSQWKGEDSATLALARIGRDSYAIYLWHLPIRLGLDAWGITPAPSVFGATLYLGGSIAMGRLATSLIERPVLRWRDERWPARSRLPP
jgi:peptidoglycan/LPS O-acetylase OafA/YrhL